MERTKKIKDPDAILTSDWHLREDTPVCRTDDFQVSQWAKVDEVRALQKLYDCPVYHAGDLFNHWKPSPALLSMTMQHLPYQFYTNYGNHDLPQHNLELDYKSGIYTLAMSQHLTILPGVHWGNKPHERDVFVDARKKILVWHVMNYQGKKPWPGCTDPMAATLLRKYPEYDLILTGHNHKSFTEEYEGRLLVNPGSLMRQNADQIDYEPKVWLWYAESNRVEPITLAYPKGVISREHIDLKEKRDDRIDAFISKLDDDWKAALNFEENLERFYHINDTDKITKEIIIKAIEL